jgi:tRNA (cmo5U34)-methyltransferase
MNNKDSIFASPLQRISDFSFDDATADVFDDMLSRSVPFYEDIQHMIVDLILTLMQDASVVCDLGCSTGTTLLMLASEMKKYNPRLKAVQLIGLDSSEAMLARARAKCEIVKPECSTTWQVRDLNSALEDSSADIFIMNLTLQFLRPLYREHLIANIHKALNPGGCLILVEKVLTNDPLFNRMYIEIYHEFKKRKGYSSLEIAQKREALENVLVPYRVGENETMLKKNGFIHTEMFFRWFNFAGYIAMKP